MSPYAVAKLTGDYYCQEFTANYGLPTDVSRYFNVLGPRQDPNSAYWAVIPKFVTLNGNRPTIYGDGLQSPDATYVNNVVRGNLAAAASPNAVGKVINVACGAQITLLQLVASLNRVLNSAIEPIMAERHSGDVRSSLADLSLAREVLTYGPEVEFEEGLRRSIAFWGIIDRATNRS